MSSTPPAPYTPEALLSERGWLLRLARSLTGKAAEAEDLVQDTLLSALRNPPRADGPVRGWLATVLRNRARLHARWRRRHPTEPIESASDAAVGSPEALVERMQLQCLLAELVLALEEPYRETVLLRYVEGLSAAEIARRTSVPPGTVRWRLMTALDRLRASLDDRHGGNRRRWILVLLPLVAPVRFFRSKELAFKVAQILAPLALLLVVTQGLRSMRARTDDRPGRLPAQPSVPAVAKAVRENSPRPDETAISGFVYDPQGRPVGGAIVTALVNRSREELWMTLLLDELHWTPTAPDGSYRLDKLPPGTYTLAATGQGHRAVEGGTVVVHPAEPQTRDLRLGEGGTELSGLVSDLGAGPLSGARVIVLTSAGELGYAFQTSTDGEGRYRLKVNLPSAMALASAEGYAPEGRWIHPDKPLALDFGLYPAASIRGRVVAAADGQPIGEAEVWIERVAEGKYTAVAGARADVRGGFTFHRLHPGEYHVWARSGGLVGARTERVVVAAAQTVEHADVPVAPGASLRGRILSTDGKPLEGAHIRLRAQNLGNSRTRHVATAVSRPDGLFAIEGLLPGALELWIDARGYTSVRKTVQVNEAGDEPVELVLSPAPTVTGVVVDPKGMPVAGVLVRATARYGAHGLTGTDGRFHLTDLGPGMLELGVMSGTLVGRAGPMPLALPGIADLRIELSPGARVSGTVRFDDGTPAAGIGVAGSWRTGVFLEVPRVRTGVDGSYSIGPFIEGSAMVRVREDGDVVAFASRHGAEQADLHLEAGEDRRGVDLVLPRRASALTGRVLGPDGRPVPGATVAASLERGREARPPKDLEGRRSLTDVDGAFTLTNLAQGPHRLWVRHPDFPELVRPAVHLPAPGLELRLSRPTALVGTVIGPRQKPVRRFVVRLIPSGPVSESPARRELRENRFDLPRREVRDERGSFAFRQLRPGRWDVRVFSPDGLVASSDAVNVEEGRETRIVLRADGGLTVRGRLVEHGTSRPLSGVTVRVWPPHAGPETSTASDGRFALVGVPPDPSTKILVAADRTHVSEPVTLWPRHGSMIDIGTLPLVPGERRPPTGGTVGLKLARGPQGLRILEVLPDQPAASHGLKAGDALVAIDGFDLRAHGPNAALQRLAGPAGTTVRLLIENERERREAVLTRAERPSP